MQNIFNETQMLRQLKNTFAPKIRLDDFGDEISRGTINTTRRYTKQFTLKPPITSLGSESLL